MPNDSVDVLAALRQVRFRYAADAPWVLDGVDLEVRAGQRIGIVGPNGAGKSTIARLLLGLLHPRDGRVELFGTAARWHTHFPALGYIGDPSYVEGALALPGELIVGQVLDVYRGLFGLDDSQLLAGLELDATRLRACRIGYLSKGERQRVLAYLALAKRPRLLLADEATEGLDAASRTLILDAVRTSLDSATAVVWISHRFDEIALLTSQVYELQEGRLDLPREALFDCTLALNGADRTCQGVTAGSLWSLLGEASRRPEVTHIRLEARKRADGRASPNS